MSDHVETQGKRFRPLTLITGITSALVALATFDPHLSNLELISFAVRRLLPVAVAVLMATALVWAVRANLYLVVQRHRVLTAIVLVVVACATLGIARELALSAPGVQRDDLRAYRGGMHSFKQVGLGYLHTVKRLVSRAAWIADYRQDMALRAEQAFADYDAVGAEGYLEAGTSSIGGEGGNAAGNRARAYLSAREIYLANHDARIAALRKQGEVSPLLIYLLRAAYTLDPTPQREAALRSDMTRAKVAIAHARLAFVACAAGRSFEPDLAWPAPRVIAHFAEATGDWPFVRGDHAGWCHLVHEAAERRQARSHVQADDDQDVSDLGDDAGQIFDDFVELYWGKLVATPARVRRAPESADMIPDSADAMAEPANDN